MYVLHAALGGCLTYPVVPRGLTEDIGGHVAYVRGAARAQARRPDVTRVDIVTRAFDVPARGTDHARLVQPVAPGMRILRLATRNMRDASREALSAERPELRRAFHALLAGTDRRPDVIHVHFADAADVVRATARAFDIPVVYTPHSLGIDNWRNGAGDANCPPTRRIEEERAALLRADAVIVSSRDEAERQVAGYGTDVDGHVHRIAPGVTKCGDGCSTGAGRRLVNPLLGPAARPMILAIARAVEKKNLVGLAEAYRRHPALPGLADLVILRGQCGPQVVQTPEGQAVIDALGALARRGRGRMALPGRHTPAEVAQLGRLAAERRGVFVNAALHEPFGLTLLEAAQAGLPVLSTREGEPVDVLRTLGHGKLVDPRDLDGIGAAIHALLTDRARWDAAAANGLRNIGLFDWDRWAAEAQRVCRGLRGAPSRPRAASGLRHRRHADGVPRRRAPVRGLGRGPGHARVVLSHGDLLDVLAPKGGKAAAVAALAAGWGLTLADCIAAGDSGNDRDMLTECGSAILVGSARAERADLPARAGLHRSALSYAHGVLDGLRRFAPSPALRVPA